MYFGPMCAYELLNIHVVNMLTYGIDMLHWIWNGRVILRAFPQSVSDSSGRNNSNQRMPQRKKKHSVFIHNSSAQAYRNIHIQMRTKMMNGSIYLIRFVHQYIIIHISIGIGRIIHVNSIHRVHAQCAAMTSFPNKWISIRRYGFSSALYVFPFASVRSSATTLFARKCLNFFHIYVIKYIIRDDDFWHNSMNRIGWGRVWVHNTVLSAAHSRTRKKKFEEG